MQTKPCCSDCLGTMHSVINACMCCRRSSHRAAASGWMELLWQRTQHCGGWEQLVLL